MRLFIHSSILVSSYDYSRKKRFLCFTSPKKSFEKHENFAKKFEMGEFLAWKSFLNFEIAKKFSIFLKFCLFFSKFYRFFSFFLRFFRKKCFFVFCKQLVDRKSRVLRKYSAFLLFFGGFPDWFLSLFLLFSVIIQGMFLF